MTFNLAGATKQNAGSTFMCGGGGANVFIH